MFLYFYSRQELNPYNVRYERSALTFKLREYFIFIITPMGIEPMLLS